MNKKRIMFQFSGKLAEAKLRGKVSNKTNKTKSSKKSK